ncbi:DUF775-domain-containing protein [Sparassis latifolia]
MFGCLVAGRLLQTNLQQVDDTHAIFELPAASTINHICVFLLGNVPFPEGYGATVHFHWPGRGFQLLGMLSNDKPSAIFRLRGTFSASSSLAHDAFTGRPLADNASADVTAILGIAIEPLSVIMQEVANLPSALARPAQSPDSTFLAERIVKHLFNYIASFVAGSGGSAALAPESMVPLAVIARWYESFVNRVRNTGIGFLERGE